MGLYTALKQLEAKPDGELSAKVKQFLSKESKVEIIQAIHAANSSVTSVLEKYISQELDRKYTFRDCLPLQKTEDNKLVPELEFILDFPLGRTTKESTLQSLRLTHSFLLGTWGFLVYVTSAPVIPIALTAVWMSAEMANSYYSTLRDEPLLCQVKGELLDRARYIDGHIDKFR